IVPFLPCTGEAQDGLNQGSYKPTAQSCQASRSRKIPCKGQICCLLSTSRRKTGPRISMGRLRAEPSSARSTAHGEQFTMTRFFRGGRGNSRFFNPNRWTRPSSASRRRNALGFELRHSTFQPLEERVMLDIGGANSVPPTIVVGRTLSAYDVPDVQNKQETITLTVYNQAADPITGVLLTDTLASG